MKKILYFVVAAMTAALVSCDDSTGTLGIDMMPVHDDINTNDSIFLIHTRTIKANPDSVVANTNECYLGRMQDPATHVSTTCDFMAQMHIVEGFSLPKFALMDKDENGQVYADSVDLGIYFDSYMGDSLTTMKMTVHELDRQTLREDTIYTTNVNPADYTSMKTSTAHSVSYAVSDLSSTVSTNQFLRHVNVRLPKEYGTRILRTYYEHPEYFANAYQFSHEVCPGFYFEHTGGTGAMLNVQLSALHIYFSYHPTPDSTAVGMKRMAATGEVIQTTRAENSPLDQLAADGSCTYLRSPSGLFTEVHLPIDSIIKGKHYNDSITNARIAFRRMNDRTSSDYKLPVPTDILLLPKSQMYQFFREGKLPDNRTSYLANFVSANNAYIFSDISKLIVWMKNERDRGAGVEPTDDEATRLHKWAVWEATHPDWDKTVLVPVKTQSVTSTTAYGTTSTTIYAVNNMYGLTSVRLEGGDAYAEGPVELSVIYSHYSK